MHRMWSGKRAACSPGGCLVNCRYEAPFFMLRGVPAPGTWQFCHKFCSEGHDGAVTPVGAAIKRRESRTVRPQ
jgi:hypothetical protein